MSKSTLESRAWARSASASLAASMGLLTAGQVLLLMMAPFTRESRAYGGASGVSLLSSDSLYFLEASQSLERLLSEAWGRWLFLGMGFVGHHLGDAATFIVIVNAAASLVAGALLIQFGRRHSGWTAGVLSASILLVNPMASQWIRFVLSESLFYSAVVAGVLVGERVLAAGETSAKATLALVGCSAALIRPNGFLVLGSAVTLIILGGAMSRSKKFLSVSLAWVALVTAVMTASIIGPSGEGTNFSQHIYDGVVVEGSPDVIVKLVMPPAPEGNDLRSLVTYAGTHPASVARLGAARLWTETHQVRRHYPSAVNIAVALAMSALFAATVLGFVAFTGGRPLPIAIATIGIPLALLVPVTFAVPEGRYGWAYLITLAPLAGIGAARLLRRSELHAAEARLSPPQPESASNHHPRSDPRP